VIQARRGDLAQARGIARTRARDDRDGRLDAHITRLNLAREPFTRE
jgi:ribosomal protein S14